MRQKTVWACIIFSWLGGTTTVTSIEVTGRTEGYYFVRDGAVAARSPSDLQRYVLARRERQPANAPASVVLGEVYRFFPICSRGIDWTRPRFAMGLRHGSIRLNC